MQAHFHSDPISEEEKDAIKNQLTEELADLKTICAKHKPEILIGSAGAFETFAAMLLADIDVKAISSAHLDVAKYQVLSLQLINSTHTERAAMPNLIALRVDMIVIAALLTNYILDELEIAALSLSTFDLKMGVLYSIREDQKLDSAV